MIRFAGAPITKRIIPMQAEPLVVVEGLITDLDGQEVMLILAPLPPIKASKGGPIQMFALAEQLWRIKPPVILVYAKPDSTLGAASPRNKKEALERKNLTTADLRKIPIYQDDLT